MDSKNGELSVKRACDCCANGKQTSDQHLLQAQAHVWNHTFHFINSMSLKCAIELSIPDIIHNHARPMTLPELLDALPIHPSKAQHVGRLMRILSHSGFFAQQKIVRDQSSRGYVLTHNSHLLLKDKPFSASPLVLAMFDPFFATQWQYMSAWFQNDDPTPFKTAHGINLWDYASQEPKFCRLVNETMASDSRLVVRMVTHGKCKDVLEGVKILVDVGGGTGTMAKGIADAFPNLECTVLDLPHVVAGLEGTKNLKFLGGDMFQAIPPANAILLKWVLHDWSDEECVKILEKCKESIASSGVERGKVIIIETVIMGENNKEKEAIETQLFLDMLMMANVSGKERNEQEWANLFSNAGFSNYKINPILGLRSIIEVYP